MKNLFTILFVLISLQVLNAQVVEPSDTVNQESNSKNTLIRYKIIKTDGGELNGEIIKQDSRELLLKTIDGREIYLPQHLISKIIKMSPLELNEKGEFIEKSPFSTRYFMSTNGFALNEGENYYLLNWWGPEIQFGLKNNLSVGIMSSWLGTPIIGTFKKSWKIKKNTHVALGALIGTGSYVNINFYGGIPFAAITFGKQTANISLSFGYGAISDIKQLSLPYDPYAPYPNEQPVEKRITDGAGMFSFSGVRKLTHSVSFIFESFFVLPDGPSNYVPIVVLSPGLRFQHKQGKAFQIGFTGVLSETVFPIPMVQWYRSF